MRKGNGELYVVIMHLPHLGLNMLVYEDQEQKTPSIFRDSADAELRAAKMRERVKEGKFQVLRVNVLGRDDDETDALKLELVSVTEERDSLRRQLSDAVTA